MNESGVVELEVEKDGMRIKIKKTGAGAETLTGPIVLDAQKIPQAQPSAASASAPAPGAVKTIEIKAPMVGTFYRAPAPEAPSYVETGQVIEPGQVVCIIEAMKLMNEIKSEVKGRILEVLVDNAEPVEFGQSMFLIEPL